MDRIRLLIGRYDLLATALLAVLVSAVALHQIATSAGGVLSPWKGGGFGMYTAPHGIDARATFLLIDGRALRLAPPDPALVAWVGEGDPAAQAYVKRLLALADRMRPYPRPADAEALMALASRVVWSGNLFGTRGDQGPTPRADMSVTVTEVARRPSAGVIEARVVFSRAGG